MHVATIRRQHNGKVYETYLLRHSFREEGKVKNETLANLTPLPKETIELIKGSLSGTSYVGADDSLEIERSLAHGHVAAVAAMAGRLGFGSLLGPACTERDIALGLVIARCLAPGSKLATSRWWQDTTLAVDLGIEGATSDEIYGAMDWLRERQGAIEARLAGRHLSRGSRVLYDLSSSWMHGTKCPLAAFGYSRDHKRGKPQIEYGLMTDFEGRPISIEVFAGNTADPTAFVSAVAAVRTRFGLEELTMVGDRGMITSARIEALRTLGGLDWITSLRAPAVRSLAQAGSLQLGLFDETSLATISHPDYPGERLIACRNPALAQERSRKRNELIEATRSALASLSASVAAKGNLDATVIAGRLGRVINRYKVAKHFVTEIAEGRFSFSVDEASVREEAALDGIYVIRTSVEESSLSDAQVVEAYKGLSAVERDFRNLKAIDLELRPVYHWTEERVRAHVFVCMLAAYLNWHLRKALAPLTFTDEEIPGRTDPVAPAQRSAGARAKDSAKLSPEGLELHSYGTLLSHLGSLSRSRIRFAGGHCTEKLSLPTPIQRRAFELIGVPIPITVRGKSTETQRR